MGIKILQIINRPAITGGMERYALDLSRSLKKRGHDVFMAVRAGTDIASAADEAGIKRIPITRGGAVQPYNVFSITRALLAEKFDILHAHTGNDYWPPLLAKWFTSSRNSRVFVTRHILSPPRGFSARFYFQNVDTVCVSDSVLQKMKGFSAPGSPLHLVYPGIDLERFTPERYEPAVRRSFKIPDGEFVIGTMHKWFSKNSAIIERLLEDFQEIKILIAGELKPHEIAQVKNLKNTERIFLTGIIKNMPEFYRSCDLFLFPSFDEAFGMVVAEAMLMGLPVLTAASGGASEIFNEGECGYKIDADRPDLYSKAFEKIYKDTEFRLKLSGNARKKGKEFSIEKMASDIESLYFKALDRK